MLNKKHNLNSGNKTKIRKRDLKDKARQKTKESKKDWWTKFKMQYLMLFFYETKAKKQDKET